MYKLKVFISMSRNHCTVRASAYLLFLHVNGESYEITNGTNRSVRVSALPLNLALQENSSPLTQCYLRGGRWNNV
jgi:hypothetical protein